MRLVTDLLSRLGSLFGRSREDAELDEEIRFHIERETERIMRTGVDVTEARRIAYTRFGGVERIRERTREARGLHRLDEVIRDLKVGLRQLATHKGFAVVATLTIAAGIGASTVILSVVRTVLLEPLPYAEPDRVVVLREASSDVPTSRVAPGTFLDWRDRSETIVDLSAHQPSMPILTGQGDAAAIRGARITADLLPMLGVPPLLGRHFLPEEAEYGRDGVVILSHGLWERRFAGDPEVIGRTIDLSGRSHLVVGVMPSTFLFPDRDTEMWTPMVFVGARNPNNRQFRFLDVVGRLADGVSVVQARSELTAISAALENEYPESKAGWSARIDPMLDTQVASVRPALLVLLTSVGFLLLITLANVAAMFLVRATSRIREVATRHALGATRARIARQLTVESVLLVAVGIAAGLALAASVIRVLPTYITEIPRIEAVRLDAWVVASAAGVGLVAGVTLGLGSMLHVFRRGPDSVLKGMERTVDHQFGQRSRSTLVVGQTALALVLLISSGLLVKSMASRARIDPGFVEENVVRALIAFPPDASSEQRLAAHREILRGLRELAGIDAVGTVQPLPTVPHPLPVAFGVDGDAMAPVAAGPTAAEYQVMPGYFAAMGIPLREGRVFTDLDVEGAPEVAVVSERLARAHFGDQSPLGRSIRLANSEVDDERVIVGVVGDVRTGTLEAEPPPQVYLPFPQLENPIGGSVLVARGPSVASPNTDVLRSAIRTLRPDLAVSDVRALSRDLSGALAQERLVTWLVTIFAVLASGLAALGVYGVVAYSTAHRSHEIGLRIMLGAAPHDMTVHLLGLGLKITVTGLALGVLASLASTRLLESLLYDIGTTDPLTFLSISVSFGAVGAVAAYLPARRASRSDPAKILRSE